MSAPDVNTCGFMFGYEESIGVLPATSRGHILEPNEVPKWGPEVSSVRRQPISKDRMPRASTVVRLNSGVEMGMDCTGEHLRIFLESVMFAVPLGRIHDVFYPTAVNADEYVVADDNVTVPDNTLIWAAGFAMTANNGLKLVAGVQSDTQIPADSIVVEAVSDDQNATVEICGFQGAAGDITLDVDGNLLSTVEDFTIKGWVVGQILHLGDPVGGAAYRFASITDDMYAEGHGFVRIRGIAAHKVILDKNEQLNINGVDAGAAKTIRVLTGAFFREWPDDHANHVKKYATLEGFFPELDGGVDNFSYARGNLPDSMTWQFPLGDIVKISMKWVGTDTPVPTALREDWEHLLEPRITEPFNTTTSYRRKRLCQLNGTAVINELKDLSITIMNNITPEEVQGRLGAFKMNVGDRSAEGDSTWLFDNPDAWSAVRNHTKHAMDIAMGGDDGGFYIDFPSCRVSDGSPGLARNTSMTTKLKIMPEKDVELGFMTGVTRFPYLP